MGGRWVGIHLFHSTHVGWAVAQFGRPRSTRSMLCCATIVHVRHTSSSRSRWMRGNAPTNCSARTRTKRDHHHTNLRNACHHRHSGAHHHAPLLSSCCCRSCCCCSRRWRCICNCALPIPLAVAQTPATAACVEVSAPKALNPTGESRAAPSPARCSGVEDGNTCDGSGTDDSKAHCCCRNRLACVSTRRRSCSTC